MMRFAVMPLALCILLETAEQVSYSLAGDPGRRRPAGITRSPRPSFDVVVSMKS